jgi:hypothetical protein
VKSSRAKSVDSGHFNKKIRRRGGNSTPLLITTLISLYFCTFSFDPVNMVDDSLVFKTSKGQSGGEAKDEKAAVVKSVGKKGSSAKILDKVNIYNGHIGNISRFGEIERAY